MMRRREFIALLGGAAVSWPLAARAQQPAMPVVGVLLAGSLQRWSGSAQFRQGLLNAGYIDGQNIRIEYRGAEDHFDRLPTLAEELVKIKADVIALSNTSATLAARQFTRVIPLVCMNCTDPVGMGLVTSESRPGTNVTGNLLRVEGLTGKQLELASELLPGLRKIGVLINVSNATNSVQRREAEAAAAALGLTIVPVTVRTPNDLYPAFQALVRQGVRAVFILQSTMFISERKRIALFALAAKLAIVSPFREIVEEGGLLSYGVDVGENNVRSAVYVARILKGEKPADMPMQFSTKLTLSINLTAAKALEIEVPPSILARADEVIE
jgi:putative ABC transport system substrate-binding protein